MLSNFPRRASPQTRCLTGGVFGGEFPIEGFPGRLNAEKVSFLVAIFLRRASPADSMIEGVAFADKLTLGGVPPRLKA